MSPHPHNNITQSWFISDFHVDAKGQASHHFSNELASVLVPDNGYSWVHLNGKDKRVLEWFKNYTALDDLWIDALTQEEIKPRFTIINDDIFFLDLRSINDFKAYDAEEMVSLRLYITRNQVITTGLTPVYVLEKMAQDFLHEKAPLNIADFLVRLITYINNAIEKTLMDAQDEMDQLEAQVLIEHDKDFREHVIKLRLQMITYKRYLSCNIDALNQFLEIESLFDKEQDHYQQLTQMVYQISHFKEEIASIKERAQVIHEELTNHLTERLTTITNKLTVLSSIILPVSCITSLFGVNLTGIPGAHNEHAFWIFSAILLIVMVLQIILFRLFKWF
jgi:zinc transporter